MGAFAMIFSAVRAIIKVGARASEKREKGVEEMKEHEFAKGMTMGVMAGMAMGAMMMPKKKNSVKRAAEKAMKTVGQVMEDLSDEMGLH